MKEPPKSLEPRFPISLLTTLDPLAERMMPLTVERLKEHACRYTGLRDFGETEGFKRRLEESVAEVSGLDWNIFGRFGIRMSLRWQLINRLHLVELLKHRPELRDIPVERPILITGLFRTGTTFLHNVMAADSSYRVGRTWEFSYPVGRKHDLMGDRGWRRRRTSVPMWFSHFVQPELTNVHRVSADQQEEDFFLVENEIMMLKFLMGLGLFPYARRMLAWPMQEIYESHRTQLQILTAQGSGLPWLLKCPWHLWHLDSFLAVYPDALVIHTHRNPTRAIASQCSLNAGIASKMRPGGVDLEEVGQFWLEYSRIGIERGLGARSHVEAGRFFDVRLHDLLADPMGMLFDIYRQFDLPWDDALGRRFAQRIKENPTHQDGHHVYDIADFGLSDARVRETLKSYCERFDV